MIVSLDLEPCFNNRSGIGIYTYNIAKNLTKFKDLELYSELFSFLGKNKFDANYNELRVKAHICKLFNYGIYRRVWNVIPATYNQLLNTHSDIYHFFDYIVPPRIEGKVITTIHDMTYLLYPEMVEKKTMKRIEKDILYSVNRADKIVTVSESSKNDIIKLLNVDKNKIEVVYNGVEYNEFSKCHSEEQKFKVKKKYKLPDRYILYMGTLEPRKNIESIIKSFNLFKLNANIKLKDMKLVIAGKKGWMYTSIFNLVNELMLENEVVFTDYVDDIDKPIIYNMASLFVFPSVYEGFGIPVLEAMASSVPVIASNIPALSEVSGDAAVLIEPKDIESIAEHMSYILLHNEYRKQLIEIGREQVKKFKWECSAKKLYDIYSDILR